MKLSAVITLATCVATAFAAPEERAASIHLRVHSHPNKFYVTPAGHQCAYGGGVMYPCYKGSTCVRLNATYGICETKVTGSTSGSTVDGSAELFNEDENASDFSDSYDETTARGSESYNNDIGFASGSEELEESEEPEGSAEFAGSEESDDSGSGWWDLDWEWFSDDESSSESRASSHNDFSAST